MARDKPVQNRNDSLTNTSLLPNQVTIVGHGVPTSYEITVDGQIEMVADDPLEEATIVSGSAVETAIESGVHRFRFSAGMATVTFVDDDSTAPSDSPAVHVEYDVPTDHDGRPGSASESTNRQSLDEYCARYD